MFFSFEFEMILSILQEMCRGKLILLILDLFCCLLPCGLKARRDVGMHQMHDQDQLFLDFPSFIQVRSTVKKLSNQIAAVSLDGHVLAFLDDFSVSWCPQHSECFQTSLCSWLLKQLLPTNKIYNTGSTNSLDLMSRMSLDCVHWWQDLQFPS